MKCMNMKRLKNILKFKKNKMIVYYNIKNYMDDDHNFILNYIKDIMKPYKSYFILEYKLSGDIGIKINIETKNKTFKEDVQTRFLRMKAYKDLKNYHDNL